jgi:hypothetical protein
MIEIRKKIRDFIISKGNKQTNNQNHIQMHTNKNNIGAKKFLDLNVDNDPELLELQRNVRLAEEQRIASEELAKKAGQTIGKKNNEERKKNKISKKKKKQTKKLQTRKEQKKKKNESKHQK